MSGCRGTAAHDCAKAVFANDSRAATRCPLTPTARPRRRWEDTPFIGITRTGPGITSRQAEPKAQSHCGEPVNQAHY